MTARQRFGDFGERVAAHLLEAHGMTIVARKVRTPSGEIDLVARDGSDIAFVEVRTRRAIPGVAAESVTTKKLRRMWRCAMEYCEANDADPEAVRIDLVSIDLDPAGNPAVVEHFVALEIPDSEDTW